MYQFRNSITHPDQLVSDKANFFADYFEFVSLDLGKIGASELENHKSLIEKVLFQLDNYTSHSKKNIVHYLSNPYLSGRDPLIKEYYSVDWKLIGKVKKRYFEKDDVNSLHQVLNAFVRKLENSLFVNSLNNVITAIQCKHPLSKHNHVEVFKYNTPLIVSEFVFAGFNNKDLHELFRTIFEKEVSLDDSKVKTRAPLPSELIGLKDDPLKFYEATREYLKKRNLKQQFEGIYFLFKNSIKDRTVIFPLRNIQAFNPISLEYEAVMFSNQLRKQYVTKKTTKGFYSFFTGKRKVFAKITIARGDEHSTVKEAVRRVQLSLNYFNSVLKLEAQLVPEDYIICEDGNCLRKSTLPKTIRYKSKKVFEDGKSQMYLEKVNSELAKRVVTSDAIYFQALGSFHHEEKLVHLWRYLESFFDKNGYKADDVKKEVSRILSEASLVSFAFVNFNLAFRILDHPYFGLSPERFNASREELWGLLHPAVVINSNFKRMREIINHPYVTAQLNWLIETTDQEKIAKGYDFYFKHLTEVYEQRNMIEHCGTFNQKAVQKAMLTLPEIVLKFRRIVSNAAKEGRIQSFQDLLTKSER